MEKKFFDFLTKKIKKFFTKNAKNRKITLWRREKWKDFDLIFDQRKSKKIFFQKTPKISN